MIRLVILLRELNMRQMNNNDDLITMISIGIAIGIGIGFLLKVFVDAYFIIGSLPQ